MTLPRTLHRLAKLTGALGLSQLSPISHKVEKRRVVYSAIISCFFFSLYPLEVFLREEAASFVEKVSLYYFAVLNPLGIIIAVTNSLYHRKTFSKTVSLLLSTSRQLGTLNECEINVPLWKFWTGITAFWAALIATENIAWEYVANTLIALIGMLYMYFYVFQVAAFVFTINALLVHLNCGFKRTFQAFQYKTPTNDEINRVWEYRRIFHEIYRISQKTNKMFSNISIWLLIHLSSNIIVGAFYFLKSVRALLIKNSKNEQYLLFLSLRWCVMGFCVLCFHIYPFAKISQQNKKLLKTINGVLVRTKNATLITELQLFSSLILQEKILFAPYNLFVLGSNIVLTVVSAAVTYLVILAQLPQSLQ